MRGGVLLEFALGMGALSAVFLAIVEMTRVLWVILLWVAMTVEVTRASALCPEGSLLLEKVSQVFNLPVTSDVLQITYRPDGCLPGACLWSSVHLFGAAVHATDNVWWPITMPDIQLSAPLEIRRWANHSFCSD